MSIGCGEDCAPGAAGRLVKLAEALGLVLAHDITEIVPGRSKGPAFKKGHIVRQEDIAHLARLGKQHLYVLEMGADQVHEDEAASRMAQAVAGPGVVLAGPPSEGKINLLAAHDGVLQIDLDRLLAFNMVPEVTLSTIHRHTPVKTGQALGGTRAIPLVVREEYVAQACVIATADGGLLGVLPYRPLAAGIVVTGNEVASGLIQDRFAPIVTDKLIKLGASVKGVKVCPDDRSAVAQAITELLQEGAQIIITTAGMSVDPDDVTRLAIADAGGRDLVYGTPILPGSMFLVGVVDGPQGETPILGAPACALFHQTTALDLILPRVLAGERFSRATIAAMAHGGFCLNCADGCRFPGCGFGRGA